MDKVKLFEDRKVRVSCNEEEEDWYFSIVDVVGILTEKDDYNQAKNYWKVLKHRLTKEGNCFLHRLRDEERKRKLYHE